MLFVGNLILVFEFIVHGDVPLVLGLLLEKFHVAVYQLVVPIFRCVVVLSIFLLFCFGSFQLGEMLLLKNHRWRSVAQLFDEAQVGGIVGLVVPRMKVERGDSRSRLLLVGRLDGGRGLHEEVPTGGSLHIEKTLQMRILLLICFF